MLQASVLFTSVTVWYHNENPCSWRASFISACFLGKIPQGMQCQRAWTFERLAKSLSRDSPQPREVMCYSDTKNVLIMENAYTEILGIIVFSWKAVLLLSNRGPFYLKISKHFFLDKIFCYDCKEKYKFKLVFLGEEMAKRFQVLCFHRPIICEWIRKGSQLKAVTSLKWQAEVAQAKIHPQNPLQS